MQIHPPTVGPLLGHTTAHQARILLRGLPNPRGNVYGVLRYKKWEDRQWSQLIIHPLDNGFDYCTVAVLDGLTAETYYEYQAGYLHSEADLATVRRHSASFTWPSEKPKRFLSGHDRSDKTRHYFLGSCRYLNMTLSKPRDVEFSDQTFGRMLDRMRQQRLIPDAFIQCGDQIYADDFNLLAPDTQLKEFQGKYREAFTTPNYRELVSQVPSYMTLDDHEIEDNWPSNATPEKRNTLYRNAIEAYTTYQASHSPVFNTQGDRVSNKESRYWYQFRHGDLEWFVLDVRTERDLTTDYPKTIGDRQMSALLDWLANSKARVKFVVTAIMLYPDLKSEQSFPQNLIYKGKPSDAWDGFPQQRNTILEHIRRRKIRNVVFISGDVHCSMVSKLLHTRDPGFNVHTIVSSPMSRHRLLANATGKDFKLDQALTSDRDGDYRHLQMGSIVSVDNFAHMTVEKNRIRVNFIDKSGKSAAPEIIVPLD